MDPLDLIYIILNPETLIGLAVGGLAAYVAWSFLPETANRGAVGALVGAIGFLVGLFFLVLC